MTGYLLATAICGLGAVTDIDGALRSALAGSAGTVAEAQAAWAETLGLRATTATGVIASGREVRVRDLDPGELEDEVTPGARLTHYVEVDGAGPAPLRLFIPRPRDGRSATVYRRLEPGLFVAPSTSPAVVGNYLRIDVDLPGRFVVHEPAVPEEGKLVFPEFPDPVDDPALKEHWRVYRVGAREVAGPVPLVLIHGIGIERWGEFIHWARFSPEAQTFRQRYQIWNFLHLGAGIDAPVGYDPACPRFDESIAAWLYRLIEAAVVDGVEHEGMHHYFPGDGPIAILSNSHGALKARAFMVNFPDYGDRVAALVTLGGPHMGTPWATPEWVRHTASRIGLLNPSVGELLAEDAFQSNFPSTRSQSDLDMGWPNFDAAGVGGIPYRRFTTWTTEEGRSERTLSPRDANVTGARALAGYDDNTFEPTTPLGTWCGGMDLVTPRFRGDRYSDRVFLYASYLDRNQGWRAMWRRAGDGVMARGENRYENMGLRIANVVMGLVASEGGDWPVSPYRAGDGFVPLQSQLMLDGLEPDLIYETREVRGWSVPVLPLRIRRDVIDTHTLADPEKIRILTGWSHLDTVTGRYDRRTGHSELFSQVGSDLVGALVPFQPIEDASRLIDKDPS